MSSVRVVEGEHGRYETDAEGAAPPPEHTVLLSVDLPLPLFWKRSPVMKIVASLVLIITSVAHGWTVGHPAAALALSTCLLSSSPSRPAIAAQPPPFAAEQQSAAARRPLRAPATKLSVATAEEAKALQDAAQSLPVCPSPNLVAIWPSFSAARPTTGGSSDPVHLLK